MANLHYGIESGKGLIVVTGEVGTGKTTILRWMMQRLDRTVLVAYIFNPRLSVSEFYQHIATLLDVQKWETKPELLMELGQELGVTSFARTAYSPDHRRSAGIVAARARRDSLAFKF